MNNSGNDISLCYATFFFGLSRFFQALIVVALAHTDKSCTKTRSESSSPSETKDFAGLEILRRRLAY